MNLFQKVFGTRSEHEVKRIMPLVEKTESLRPEMQKLTDANRSACYRIELYTCCF